MKSKTILAGISVAFLLLATVSSVVIWPDVPFAAKVAFFAFGYGAGITTGAWLVRRSQ